jgi:hypothetical protein
VWAAESAKLLEAEVFECWWASEESILLRSLATGSTVKEMAGQLRLPRESLFRLLGDLRRKTGAADDTALRFGDCER